MVLKDTEYKIMESIHLNSNIMHFQASNYICIGIFKHKS